MGFLHFGAFKIVLFNFYKRSRLGNYELISFFICVFFTCNFILICLGQHHHQLRVPAFWYGLGHDDVPPAPGIMFSPTDDVPQV